MNQFAAQHPAGLPGPHGVNQALAAMPGAAGRNASAYALPPWSGPPAAAVAPMLRAASPVAPILLAIGSSTGGPNALFKVVQSLSPGIGVPVIITQHMPATFTTLLADHLHRLGVLPCREAVDGARLRAGEIVLAPGGFHLLVRRGAAGLFVSLSQAPPENYCRPAVDPMFRSAASATHGRVLAVILTGMGADGMAGARAIVDGGGTVLAQDEASSVVWGMPGAVARAGLAHAILPLEQIGPRILALLGAAP